MDRTANSTDLTQIAYRYIRAYNDVSMDIIERALNNFPDNVIANDELVFMFVKLSDHRFDMVKAMPAVLQQEDFLTNCYFDAGPHIHLLKIFGQSRGFKKLIKELIDVYNPSDVTFYRDDFKRLHTVYTRS